MATTDPRIDAYIQNAAPFAKPMAALKKWITEARQEATRAIRLSTAVGWIAEGKQRNWKYMK